jgi:hypothetical protein
LYFGFSRVNASISIALSHFGLFRFETSDANTFEWFLIAVNSTRSTLPPHHFAFQCCPGRPAFPGHPATPTPYRTVAFADNLEAKVGLATVGAGVVLIISSALCTWSSIVACVSVGDCRVDGRRVACPLLWFVILTVSFACGLIAIVSLSHNPESVDTEVRAIPAATATPRHSARSMRTARAPLEELQVFPMIRLTFIVVSAIEAVVLVASVAFVYWKRLTCHSESIHWSPFDESTDPHPDTPPSDSSGSLFLSSPLSGTEEDEEILE